MRGLSYEGVPNLCLKKWCDYEECREPAMAPYSVSRGPAEPRQLDHGHRAGTRIPDLATCEADDGAGLDRRSGAGAHARWLSLSFPKSIRARDGADALGYELVEAPSRSKAEPRKPANPPRRPASRPRKPGSLT
jgi:hypothetical protein